MKLRGIVAAPLVTAALPLLVEPAAAAVDCTGPEALSSRSFTMTHQDGTTTTVSDWDNSSVNDEVQPGDVIVATYTVKEECEGTRIGLASYQASTPTFDPTTTQSLYDSDTSTAGGTNTLTIEVPLTAGDGTADCPNKHQDGPETKDKGANTSGAYDSTCDGSPSGNGNANGEPCAGCVGNADDKNPPGQHPDRSDPNAGYECDRNQGVGKTNPAHTGCRPLFFQVDLFTGDVLPFVDGTHRYGPRLIDAYNGPKS